MKKYTVEYMTHSASEVYEITVEANNKIEAYDKAVYEALPELPYSAWVASVTYANGNTREFNTFSGKPY